MEIRPLSLHAAPPGTSALRGPAPEAASAPGPQDGVVLGPLPGAPDPAEAPQTARATSLSHAVGAAGLGALSLFGGLVGVVRAPRAGLL